MSAYVLVYQISDLADPLVDRELELWAHIEAEAVAVPRLVLEIEEAGKDRARSHQLKVPGWFSCTPSVAVACMDPYKW
jgi:hypothetical protein